MPDGSAPKSSEFPIAARVIRLTDFDQTADLFSSWDGRFEQITSGQFQALLQVVQCKTIRGIAIEGNQKIEARGRDTSGLFSIYPVTDENAGSVWHGMRLPPGRIVVTGPEASVHHVSSRRTRLCGLSVRPEVLFDSARVLIGGEHPPIPTSWAALAPPPKVFNELTRRFRALLALGTGNPSLLGTPEAHRLEQECIRTLISVVFSSATESTHQTSSPPARSDLIRRANDLMRAKLGDAIGAIDLCRELQVSDRTLRLVFRERYGLGPMTYYRCLRLNAVRSRLKEDPLVSVAAAARTFGFHHLGNFAADFRRLFGFLPSGSRPE